MPKKLVNALSPPGVKALGPGRYADGGGLYLLVASCGSRSWIVRYRAAGKGREAGLGPAKGNGAVTLAQARVAAREFFDKVRSGVDPLVERDSIAAAIAAETRAAVIRAKTFKEVAGLYIATHEQAWRNPKHRAQWASTLATYAYPHFGDVSVGEISTADVVAALEPIWALKTETATRLRGRIESILDYATAREWRSGANPARWKGHLKNMLAAPSKLAPVKHFAALPWVQIGEFLTALRARRATAARALEFTCLTAVRTGEVLGATWCEIDRGTALWTIPGGRTKSGREHRVPLAASALTVLDEMETLRPQNDPFGQALIFPGTKAGMPLSGMAMLMLLRRMDYAIGDLTVHGFRSTFKDWASEATNYSNEVTEMALGHVIEDKTQAAYRRGDLFEKRKTMMTAWAEFCARPTSPAGDGKPVARLA